MYLVDFFQNSPGMIDNLGAEYLNQTIKSYTWNSVRVIVCFFLHHCKDNYAIWNCVVGFMKYVTCIFLNVQAFENRHTLAFHYVVRMSTQSIYGSR